MCDTTSHFVRTEAGIGSCTSNLSPPDFSYKRDRDGLTVLELVKRENSLINERNFLENFRAFDAHFFSVNLAVQNIDETLRWRIKPLLGPGYWSASRLLRSLRRLI